MPVQTLDIVQERLIELNQAMGLSWRKIAKMDAYKGIPPGTLNAISKGRNPKKLEHRTILGLSIIVTQYKDPVTGRYVEKG